jgi:tRNA nucleotidyltransferase (CCA-adding enzyme)
VDPFGGHEDLSRGIVRCVGSALQRFSEDGLRPLRAVRFAAVLGFALEPQTAAAIPQALDVFRKVSRERIRAELEKLLLSTRPELGLVLLHDSGLLACFLPEALGAGFVARAAQAQAAPPELEVRLAVVLSYVEPPIARDALARLTFPNKVADRVALLLAYPLPADPIDASDADLRRWLSALGTDAVDQAISFFLALSRLAPDRAELLQSRIRALLAARPPLAVRDLALDGTEIMRLLGVGPSRVVGQATEFLLSAVLERPEANTSETLAALLRDWARSRPA